MYKLRRRVFGHRKIGPPSPRRIVFNYDRLIHTGRDYRIHWNPNFRQVLSYLRQKRRIKGDLPAWIMAVRN
jgi:hypothetical protein